MCSTTELSSYEESRHFSNPFSSAKNTVFNCVINCSTHQFISIPTNPLSDSATFSLYPMQLFVMLLIKIKIMIILFVCFCLWLLVLSFRFWCHYFFFKWKNLFKIAEYDLVMKEKQTKKNLLSITYINLKRYCLA